MNDEIVSKKGLLMNLGMFIVSILGLLGLIAFLRFIFIQQPLLSQDALTVLAGGVGLTLASFFYWSSNIIVKEATIHQGSIFGKKTTLWRNVHSLNVRSNFYGKYYFTLYQHGARNKVIVSSFFKNDREIIKASLEAVSHANPSVIFNGLAQDFLHQPPYDVLNFSPEKKPKSQSGKVYKTQTFRRD